MGEEENDLRYSEEVHSTGDTFFPLVVESSGLWSDDSLKSLKLIASKTTSRSTVSLSVDFMSLMQQLSVRLWQHNARVNYKYL